MRKIKMISDNQNIIKQLSYYFEIFQYFTKNHDISYYKLSIVNHKSKIAAFNRINLS